MSEEKEIYEIERDTSRILNLNSEAESLLGEGKEEEALKKLKEVEELMKEMIKFEEFMRGRIIKREEEEISINKHLSQYLEELERKIRLAKEYIKKEKDIQ